jgi:GGDEF domain-containing protein
MSAAEIAVWSAMLGGLLTLVALALADVIVNFKRGGLRNVFFVLFAGSACVVMSGLLREFIPGLLPVWAVQGIKGSIGPAAGAVALYYLGIWMGGSREDRTVHFMTAWGGLAVGLASLVLAGLAVQASPEGFVTLLYWTALFNLTAALLGLAATLRAAKLGDPLARWMAIACVGLVLLIAGLYLKALEVPGFGLGTWIATATITVLYFLACIMLVMLRNREQRQLTRLASLQVGADPATGLPTGSVLLGEVEHAFWRTSRLHGECTLVCLHVANLYELSTVAGHGVEQQIQVAIAARIRRAAGFRCVVGLYQPRCFVVVISADKRREYVQETVMRMRALAARPLMVTGRDQTRHEFVPRLSQGIVTLQHPGRALPLEVIHEAERRALISDTRNPGPPPPPPPPPSVQDTIPTQPAPFA